jgi:hypothetical protein
MPTLPLYVPNDVPDAWHQVIAPGGYETWHFYAQAASTETCLVVELGQGYRYQREYLRKYFDYRRRPTRRPPPVPANYPNVRVWILERRRLVARLMLQTPTATFGVAPAQPIAVVGPVSVSRQSDGALTLHLSAHQEWEWSGRLSFRAAPTGQALQLPMADPGLTPDEHHWIAGPSCEVTGELVAPGVRTIEFRGHGRHDHCFGTGPLALGVARSVFGRMLLPSRSLSFLVTQPRNGGVIEARVIEADIYGNRQIPVEQLELTWAGRFGSARRLIRELQVSLQGGEKLAVGGAEVFEAGDGVTWQTCVGRVGQDTGTALCEVVVPGTSLSRGFGPRGEFTGWG